MSSQPERPPYESYAAIAGAYGGLLTAVTRVGKALGRPAPKLGPVEIAALGMASFKAGRTLARDKVASFVRAPFVEGEASTGEDEEPAGEGLQQALGELLTCTRCVGTWSAAGLASLLVLTPRFGRLVVLVLDAGAVNDFLQAGFTALTAKCNALERQRA